MTASAASSEQHLNGTVKRGEETPLLVSLSLDINEEAYEAVRVSSSASSPISNQQQKATVNQAALNIAKLCMGTGTLALPYAACQGGLLLNTVGLGLVSVWNFYSVDRLVKCLDLLPPGGDDDDYDGENSSSSSPVIIPDNDEREESSAGKGKKQHRRTSSTMRRIFRKMSSNRIVFDETDLGDEEEEEDKQQHQQQQQQQLGVFSNIYGPPPEGTTTFGKVAWHAFGPWGLRLLDLSMIILLLGVIISYEDAIISFIKDTPFTTGSTALDSIWTVLVIGPLSCVPDMRYLAKFSAMGIFTIFFTFAVIGVYGIVGNGLAGFGQISWDDLWPESIASISNWFGCVVFGFGVVPITYNIRDSMAEPHLMTRATEKALWVVFATYAVIGDGVTILFSPSVGTFDGDVLQVLPDTWIPTVVRLAMTFVVLVTAPLLVVPCGELIEGKIGLRGENQCTVRVLVRLLICLFCTGVSVLVPGFVHVISFVGCFCVAMVGFVFPPLFHVRLTRLTSEVTLTSRSICNGSNFEDIGKRDTMCLDVALLSWGIIATAITSLLTFKDMIQHSD